MDQDINKVLSSINSNLDSIAYQMREFEGAIKPLPQKRDFVQKSMF